MTGFWAGWCRDHPSPSTFYCKRTYSTKPKWSGRIKLCRKCENLFPVEQGGFPKSLHGKSQIPFINGTNETSNLVLGGTDQDRIGCYRPANNLRNNFSKHAKLLKSTYGARRTVMLKYLDVLGRGLSPQTQSQLRWQLTCRSVCSVLRRGRLAGQFRFIIMKINEVLLFMKGK